MRTVLAVLCVVLLGAAQPLSADDGTLYAKLGEEAGLQRVVGRTIDLSLADERIGKTFDNTNIPRLKKLLVEHLCQLTGGPCRYTGRDMRKSHSTLKLQNYHFNAMVENLQTAMDESDIPFSTQNELLAILAPMQRDVTAGSHAAAPEGAKP
jgi:hemoglobin